MPLSADEAYYWIWSKALAPGYIDHPPMVALFIAAGTALLGDTALGVRLLAPLSAAAGSVLLASAGAALFPGEPDGGRRIGVRAAVLLNATLLLNAGAVTMTPDTPLLLFWTAATAALARVGSHRTWWLVVGVLSGLAMDSKYTAVFLGIAIVLWLLVCARDEFLRWQLWAGGALAMAVFAPVVWWNAGHGWISFVRQGGRAADWLPTRAWQHLGDLVGGQILLATPLVALVLAVGLVALVRHRTDPARVLLAALTLPAMLVFVQHALGDRVQANWPSIIYPGAALAAAVVVTRLWRPAVVTGYVISGAVMLQAAAAPLVLPRKYDPLLIRLGGWDTLAQDLRDLQGDGFVAAENYGVASLLAWHLPGATVLGTDPRLQALDLPRRSQHPLPATGVLIQSTRRSEPPDPAVWDRIVPLPDLVRARHGVVAETYHAYRVSLRGTAIRLPERP